MSHLTLHFLLEIVAGLIVAGFTGAFIFLFKRVPRDLGQFSRDWNGTPARPGFPEIPGVPQRLERVEALLSNISHEVNYNSGSSIKDAVHRTDLAVAKLQGDVTALQETLDKQ